MNELELQQKVRKANRLLNEMIEDGYGELSVINLSLEQVRKVLGADYEIDSFPGTAIIPPSKMQIYEKILDKFTKSDWTTEDGREKIFQKRLSSFENDNKLDRETALKLYDIFDTDVYHQMVEKHLLDSKQFVDIVKRARNKDYSSTNFEQAITAMLHADSKIQPGTARRFITRFLRKKSSED